MYVNKYSADVSMLVKILLAYLKWILNAFFMVSEHLSPSHHFGFTYGRYLGGYYYHLLSRAEQLVNTMDRLTVRTVLSKIKPFSHSITFTQSMITRTVYYYLSILSCQNVQLRDRVAAIWSLYYTTLRLKFSISFMWQVGWKQPLGMDSWVWENS